MIILEGKHSLLALIDECPLADIEICRRPGVGVNTISGMRSDPKRSLHWVTVRALVEAMGYKICLTK